MKTFKNKRISSATAMLLILSFVISMFAAAGIANAQTNRELRTHPFIDAIPKAAGVGQHILINFGLLNQLARDGDGWNVTAIVIAVQLFVNCMVRV